MAVIVNPGGQWRMAGPAACLLSSSPSSPKDDLSPIFARAFVAPVNNRFRISRILIARSVSCAFYPRIFYIVVHRRFERIIFPEIDEVLF